MKECPYCFTELVDGCWCPYHPELGEEEEPELSEPYPLGVYSIAAAYRELNAPIP